MDPTLPAAFLVLLFAYSVKGLTGFASALIAVPILTALYGAVPPALIVMALLELVFSAVMVPITWRRADRTAFFLLVAGATVGSLLGVEVLKAVAAPVIQVALGVVIAGFGVVIAVRAGYPAAKVRKRWGLIAGLTGGLLGGAFGTPGPPFVIYMAGQAPDKEAFRATLLAAFAVGALWRLVLYAGAGFFTAPGALRALCLVPACLMGMALGHRLHQRIEERTFRRLVGVLVIGSGLLCLLRAAP